MRQDFQKLGVLKYGKERYDVSPFVDLLEVQTKKRRLTVAKGPLSALNTSTGEVSQMVCVVDHKDYDPEQFVKVFTGDLARWFDLSKAGQRVFGALLQEVQQHKNKDLIYFDFCLKSVSDFKISRPTFYRGLGELVSKSFIAPYLSQSMFFINPAMFFNGDRALFVRDYRIRKVESHQQSLPFEEPQDDPLFDKELYARDPVFDRATQAELCRRAAEMDAGINCMVHELIDDDDV